MKHAIPALNCLLKYKKLSETVSEVARSSTPSGKRKKVSQGVGEILTSEMVAQRLKNEAETKLTS